MFTDICCMHLLLVSATDFEIAETSKFLKSDHEMKGLEIDILCSGVGMVPTSYTLTRKIIEKNPDLIIQAGIGGCNDSAQIGNSFAISSESFADLGVTENNHFRSIFDLNLADKHDFPFENGWLVNPNLNLLKVKGITINEITTDSRKLMEYKQNDRGIVVESMEGAALHYVALMEKIPFLQIRTVSNEMGERDKSKWKLQESIKNLNQSLITVLQKINAAHENDFRL
jgi:futalosine hydrolase